ncbi:uncharacterized protein LOC132725596 [Ruditapes philippinarum]|uniref:uncharacterized protein LOC132725596 n=1 Tax=Ruditapes philippinarum TaxID=129788 RepID=UPI00295B1785|nr:uncharacterized protein LOC132725596 [Ruditapes philippinarum]
MCLHTHCRGLEEPGKKITHQYKLKMAEGLAILAVDLVLPEVIKSMRQQHNTHVTNGLNRMVKVEIKHMGREHNILRVEPGKTRNVPTEHGKVTISVYDAPTDKKPYESMTLQSDQSVCIEKNAEGKPQIRCVKYGTLTQCIGDADNFK